MLDKTVQIVIAMINNDLIGCHSDPSRNIEDVKNAINEINKQLQSTHFGD